MRFSYSSHIQQTFPARVSGVLAIDGIGPLADTAEAIEAFARMAESRLARHSEGEFPEIQAWRRAFSTMGLKPTQYRCAAEALLRRYRKDGSLPSLHPLVDLCNAASIAFAVPIAVFDRSRIDGDLIVRQADGTERYESFSGEIEHREAEEIIFADEADHAHARRWAKRQSKLSAVSDATIEALIVAEALHDGAADDMDGLVEALGRAARDAFGSEVASALLLTPEAAFAHPPEA